MLEIKANFAMSRKLLVLFHWAVMPFFAACSRTSALTFTKDGIRLPYKPWGPAPPCSVLINESCILSHAALWIGNEIRGLGLEEVEFEEEVIISLSPEGLMKLSIDGCDWGIGLGTKEPRGRGPRPEPESQCSLLL
jgi:hypothetical protein